MVPFDSLPPTAVDSTVERRSVPRRRTLLAALLAAPVVLLGIGIAVRDPHPPEPTASSAPVSLATARERLDRIHDAFPSTLEEHACTKSVGSGSPLLDFSALARFRHRDSAERRPADAFEISSFELNDEGLPHLGGVEHIAVLKATTLVRPGGSLNAPEPGHYEGWLVIFDRGARPICATHIVTWSSRYAMEPGISARAIRDDFVERVRSSVNDGAYRLSPNHFLEF